MAGAAWKQMFNSCKLNRRSMHSVSKAASIKKAPMNHASRGYHTRVAPRAATAVRPPLLFEQRLGDRPLVRSMPVRYDRSTATVYEKTSNLTLIGGTLTNAT